MVENLELYLVRNQEGKWFCIKGGDWTNDLKKARVYQNIGSARAKVTWYANHYPRYGIPEIIKLNICGFEVIDEKDRVNKVIEKIKENQEKQRVTRQEQRIRKAEEELNRVKSDFNKLKENYETPYKTL